MKPDPMRWSDSRSGTPPALRRALLELRDQPVDESAAQELMARLLRDACAKPSVKAISRFAPSVRLWLVAGALALLEPGAHQHRTAPQPLAAARTTPIQAPPVSPASVEHRAAPVAPRQLMAAEPRFDVAKRTPLPRAHRSANPADELTLLTEAQAALEHDAARTLERTATHSRLYPHGTFEQEREILAIEALLELERGTEAQARANAFLAHHPDSPHALGLRAVLERQRNDARRAR